MPTVDATKPELTRNRACSSAKIDASRAVPPRPPYSTGHVIPAQPPSNSARCQPRLASKRSRSVAAASSRARVAGAWAASHARACARNVPSSSTAPRWHYLQVEATLAPAGASELTRGHAPRWFLAAVLVLSFAGVATRVAMVAFVHEPSQPGFLVDYDPIFYSRQANLVADGEGFIAPYLLDAQGNGPHRPSAGH